jgi:hypothetical protein
MLRPLLVVTALLAIAAVAPAPSLAATASPEWAEAAVSVVSMTGIAVPWNLLGEWLGIRPTCGPLIDPMGGCSGSTPIHPSNAIHPVKRAARPRKTDPHVECGPLGDPVGCPTLPTPAGRRSARPR